MVWKFCKQTVAELFCALCSQMKDTHKQNSSAVVGYNGYFSLKYTKFFQKTTIPVRNTLGPWYSGIWLVVCGATTCGCSDYSVQPYRFRGPEADAERKEGLQENYHRPIHDHHCHMRCADGFSSDLGCCFGWVWTDPLSSAPVAMPVYKKSLPVKGRELCCKIGLDTSWFPRFLCYRQFNPVLLKPPFWPLLFRAVVSRSHLPETRPLQ